MKHPAIETGIYSIEDLKNDYYRKTKGHWFDKDTMSFFDSKTYEPLIYCGAEKILFISSEQGPFKDSPRRYSIREYSIISGEINTIGLGFQGYKTLAAATRAAQKRGVQ